MHSSLLASALHGVARLEAYLFGLVVSLDQQWATLPLKTRDCC